MDRFWFLTWHTYGTWLPGDERGFVSAVRDSDDRRVVHNQPGTPYDRNLPSLEAYCRDRMKGAPVLLTAPLAEALFVRLEETAAHRAWTLLAVGVIATHAHVVLGVPDDPDPEDLLRDVKSYGSRRLNRCATRPASGTWWTRSGSKRKLPHQESVLGAIRYVVTQEAPLLIWTAPVPELSLTGGRIV
jgi:hypothetical protein